MAKYTLWYSSTTGYGWKEKSNRIDEFEDFIREQSINRYSSIEVYEEGIGFVYIKRIGDVTPEISIFDNILRDLRTTTKKVKA